MRRVLAIASAIALFAVFAPRAGAVVPTVIGSGDWPTYGHSELHDFHAKTSLTKQTVRTLLPKWFFPTGDVVSANPVEVAGVIYVGSWDGYFYAIDARTGTLRWKYRVKDQAKIMPKPGHRLPTDITSDGGIITSSAYFQPGDGTRPDLVIFGGGYTLYALRASDGSPYWMKDFSGRPDRAPNPALDPTRIFSSPVVVGDRVLFAVTPNGTSGYRGYAAAADLATGNLVWRFETDLDKTGRIINDGCGGVWSSPTVFRSLNIAVYDVADCHFSNPHPLDEKVFAVDITTGAKRWIFDPKRPDAGCDYDFGATANGGVASDGTPTFLGVGGKDGTYYSIDPAAGTLRWKRNVVFGGFSGGFIATTAYDGHHVVGATAIGDFGRFEGFGDLGCKPLNLRDLPAQEPTLHAFDARDGSYTWHQRASLSFAPTSIAGGMSFVCADIGPQNPLQRVDIRDVLTGQLVWLLPLPVGCQSGVIEVGNTIFFGTGTGEEPQPAGIWAYTPRAEAVSIPR